MKGAVGRHVPAHGSHRSRWINGGQHVVPLQNLMQQNPIQETTQAQAQQEPGETGAEARGFSRGHAFIVAQ